MRLREYKKFIWVIGIAAVLLIGAGILVKGEGRLFGLKGMVQEAASFITKPVSAAASGIKDGFRGIFRFKDVLAENESLKVENEKLRQKNRQLQLTKSQKQELEELQELFQYESLKQEQVVAADVTAMDYANWEGVFLIDQGSEDGIKEGCAVISADGLVGRITAVSRNTAQVATLLSEQAKVSFETEKGGQMGVLHSDGGKGLTGYLLEDEKTLKKGTRLVTSGIGTYPEGLDLGRVTRIEKKKGTQRILVEAIPAVSFFRLKKVGVIL